MSAPSAVAPAARPTTSFDWGLAGEENADLTPVILDIVAEAGWPYSNMLFQLACVSHEFKDACTPRIEKRLEEMRRHYQLTIASGCKWHGYQKAFDESYETWEAIAASDLGLQAEAPILNSSFHDDHEAAKVAFRIVLNGSMHPRTARMIHEHLTGLHDTQRRDPTNKVLSAEDAWTFEFAHATVAHAAQQKCMMCSGIKQRCPCDMWSSKFPSTSFGNDGSPWQFRSFEGVDLFYGKAQCIAGQVILPKDAASSRMHGDWHPTATDRSKLAFDTWSLTQAMMHQVGKYDDDAIKRVVFPDRVQVRPLPVLICKNACFPGKSIQERLGLSDVQLAGARAETERLRNVFQEEEDAAQEARINKLKKDCDAYLCRLLGEGWTVALVTMGLPMAERTLDRLLRHVDAEPFIAHRYLDAAAAPRVRAYADKLVALGKVLAPAEEYLHGKGNPGLSPNAYEWLLGLNSYSVQKRRDRGDLTHFCEWGLADFWRQQASPEASNLSPSDKLELRERLDYMCAAAHIFDTIGTTFTLTVEVRSKPGGMAGVYGTCHVRWLLCSSRGLYFHGRVPRRWWLQARTLHKMVDACFKEEHVDKLPTGGEEEGSDLRLRRLPTRPTWTAKAKVRATLASKIAVTQEVSDYYRDVAGTLVLFPATRFAGLDLLDITPLTIAKRLRCFHEAWKSGAVNVPGTPLCPHGADSFAQWVISDPSNPECTAGSASPSAVPQPPLVGHGNLTMCDASGNVFDDEESGDDWSDEWSDEEGDREGDGEGGGPSCKYSPTSPQYDPCAVPGSPELCSEAEAEDEEGGEDSDEEDGDSEDSDEESWEDVC